MTKQELKMFSKNSVHFLSLAIFLVGCRTVASSNQCMVMKDSGPQFSLSGKLAVSYSNASIDEDDGHLQEMGVVNLADSQRTIHEITKKNSAETRRALRAIHGKEDVHEAEVDISPDGKQMLFTTRNQRDYFEGPSAIWIRNMDGSANPLDREPLVKESGAYQIGGAIWAYPRGESFIYAKWPKNGDSGPFSGALRLYRYDFASKRSTEVFKDLTRSGEVGDPEPSYDGKMLTFKMTVEGDRNDQPSIYVINMDGTGLQRLTGIDPETGRPDTRNQFSDHDPIFSRDGKTVYFERYHGDGDWFGSDDNRWSIVAVDVATKKEKTIVPFDPCARHIFWLPTISPDGKHIMYIHNDTQAWKEKTVWTDLWVTDLEGKNHQKVKGSDYIYWLDWSE